MKNIKKKMAHITVDEDLWGLFGKFCEERGAKKSTMVRVLVRKWIQECEKEDFKEVKK